MIANKLLFWSITLCSLSIPIFLIAQQPDPTSSSEPKFDLHSVKPTWDVGDRWIVETRTRPIQIRTDSNAGVRSVNWEFKVDSFGDFHGRKTFVVKIRCLDETSHRPDLSLWVDQETLAYRQIQTQLPIQGGTRTMTENYDFRDGMGAPVVSPISALPIELPVFLKNVKSVGQFSYRAVSGVVGSKDVGNTAFEFSTNITTNAVRFEDVKSVLPVKELKLSADSAVLQVRIRGPRKSVSQLWIANQPWPAHVDNGATQSRLVKVIPADQE